MIKHSKEILEAAVKESVSFAGVCRVLGVKPFTGNQSYITNQIKKFQIDCSHFTGQAWNKGKTFGPQRPLEDYFSNTQKISSHVLKKKLFRFKIKEAKCEICGIAEWQDKAAPLELDHNNGDHLDNRLENLRILCANCHSVFGVVTRYGKIIRNGPTEVLLKDLSISIVCPVCGRNKKNKSKLCIKCHIREVNKNKDLSNYQFSNPNEIFDYVSKFGYRAASRKYNLSDNGIRKRLKKAGLNVIKQYPKNLIIGINR